MDAYGYAVACVVAGSCISPAGDLSSTAATGSFCASIPDPLDGTSFLASVIRVTDDGSYVRLI